MNSSAGERAALLDDTDWAALAVLRGSGREPTGDRAAQVALLSLGAHYFLAAKSDDGKPFDPVARFHLGNGASLARLNWMADTSPKGMAEALGLMVNYRYDLDQIEENHEAFANDGTVAAARSVRALIRVAAQAQGAH